MKNTNKKHLFFIILIVIFFITVNTVAQVGIGTTTPNSNAMLDVESTTKGFLPPRMTTAQKNTLGGSLNSADKGMLVFDTDLTAFYYWDGTQWLLIRIDSVVTDEDSTANMYLSTTPSETSLSAGVVAKVVGNTSSPSGVNINFTNSGTGRLTYTGEDTQIFSVVCSLSFSGKINQTDDTYSFYINECPISSKKTWLFNFLENSVSTIFSNAHSS